jgi:flagellar protein FliJ
MFQFKLQSVLDYRLNVEEKILNEFSDVKRYLEEQKAVLQSLVSERESLMNDLRKMENAMIHADDVATLVGFIENVRGQETEQKKVIQQAGEQVEKKRKELVEAVKNRKVMENLRDRQSEEYRKNMNEMEQKNSDEMSILKYGRRET